MRFFRSRDGSAPAPASPTPGGGAPARPRPGVWRSYDAVAGGFDRFLTRATSPFAEDLVRALEPRPGERVLDVGAGSGIAAPFIRTAAGPDAVVVAADASLEMVRLGRAAHRPAAFVAAQAVDLPFRDMTFDVELANFVIGHFTKIETGLFDMRRVLKPGGRVGVTAWTDTDDAFSDAWTEVAERAVGREILRDERKRLSPHEGKLGTPEQLRDVLYAGGFRKIRVERHQHRVEWTRADFLASRNSLRLARFIESMLGETGFARFQDDLASTFADRFPETFGDTNHALVAVAIRED